jgi:Zn-dependent protease with chaperone function
MFVLRCLGVSLSCFLLLYAALSFLVMRGWRMTYRACARMSALRAANLLFTLRTLPFATALLMTSIFVIPSFLLLEPRVVVEPIGGIPLTLGAICLLLLGVGIGNAVDAQRKTADAVKGWLRDATTDANCYPVPLFRIRPSTPALAVAGGLSPRVLLSESAAALLSPYELEAALKHEVAHVERRDNLKKLLFRLFSFPGLSALESAWSDKAEMAADDAAVSNSREALDLASALIKLSRFAPPQKLAILATSLAQTPGSTLNARIERLISWDETHLSNSSESLLKYTMPAFLALTIWVVATYGVVLSDMHKMTEWLVQ